MDKELNHFIKQLLPTLIFVAILCFIHLFSFLAKKDFSTLGILPQTTEGLLGIFTAPLIHGSKEHLFANVSMLIFVGVMFNAYYPSIAYRVFVGLYVLTGVLVWSFARQVYHIGASGVLYALVSFIFWSGIFRKSKKSSFLAFGILSIYGTMFEGVLPKTPGVSWESHLYGAVIGFIMAYFFKNHLEKDEEKSPYPNAIPYEQRPFLFARDTFQYTKAERIAMEEERLRLEREAAHQRWLAEQQALQQQQQNEQGQWFSNHS
jgi:membrane associated rhomboid family serine protease